jgi:hypothetical protein
MLHYTTPYITTYQRDKAFCGLGKCAVIVPGTLSKQGSTGSSLLFSSKKIPYDS